MPNGWSITQILSETVWYIPDLSEPSNLSDHPELRESRSDHPELSASPIFEGGHLPGYSIHPDWGATKNSAVALGSRNTDMLSIHQRSARTNETPAPDNSPQSIGELRNGHVANLQELYFTRLVRKMAWYKILIHVLIVVPQNYDVFPLLMMQKNMLN